MKALTQSILNTLFFSGDTEAQRVWLMYHPRGIGGVSGTQVFFARHPCTCHGDISVPNPLSFPRWRPTGRHWHWQDTVHAQLGKAVHVASKLLF